MKHKFKILLLSTLLLLGLSSCRKVNADRIENVWELINITNNEGDVREPSDMDASQVLFNFKENRELTISIIDNSSIERSNVTEWNWLVEGESIVFEDNVFDLNEVTIAKLNKNNLEFENQTDYFVFKRYK